MSTSADIAVVGASSFIGHPLYQSLRSFGQVVGTYHRHRISREHVPLDVTQEKALFDFFTRYRPKITIWVAGNKNVKQLEDSPELAESVNCRPIQYLAKHLPGLWPEGRLLFFSTDYVFEGSRGNYTDRDVPNPETIYGKSKLLAEKALFESSLDTKIFRTSAVMGKRGTFFDWVCSELKANRSINAYDDIRFTPTSLNLLTKAIRTLILDWDNLDQKVFHYSGGEVISRYRFILLMKELLGSKSPVVPGASDNSLLIPKDLSIAPSEHFSKINGSELKQWLGSELAS